MLSITHGIRCSHLVTLIFISILIVTVSIQSFLLRRGRQTYDHILKHLINNISACPKRVNCAKFTVELRAIGHDHFIKTR